MLISIYMHKNGNSNQRICILNNLVLETLLKFKDENTKPQPCIFVFTPKCCKHRTEGILLAWLAEMIRIKSLSPTVLVNLTIK